MSPDGKQLYVGENSGNLGVAIAIFNRAVSAPPPAGNPAALAFARTVTVGTSRFPGEVETRTGFLVMRDSARANTISWEGDYGKVPAGYVPVVEHLTIAANGGRGVWASDIMSPSCSGCTEVAYQVLLRSSGLVGHFLPNGPATAGTCWQHLSGGFGWQTGDVYFGPFNGIVYQPLRRSGGTVFLTTGFPYGSGRATEVDTIQAGHPVAGEQPPPGLGDSRCTGIRLLLDRPMDEPLPRDAIGLALLLKPK